ncbi:hypothetical protein AYR62_11500 [Secundilactobacillus paracollinoides]|uniref:N-acetyltransferase domain-containing protein n=1 Tax=Secundilactobacillus paracollinoides TaxID=240427 RepID=A0A1B2IXR4_9LACO|nr:GNAT family N-acetyltransferase [Secundilactobacillus paracollinoides]ANZ60998.1 hypothetical protein AYR61_06340 [Secundilactobacillus paracollinoides]ANZ64639.1 hypothetical protein AYR62_11500 [Secundilactobacillus paracollinoides]ANZ66855.1 hypothetical protein AYR63_06700 [Secundilactobacillus paracollinoides]KRL79528.1 hypothetical protein FC17_GL000353 [Secundilactobacillus paracollinoides DSM 15502 = JCM 11969]
MKIQNITANNDAEMAAILRTDLEDLNLNLPGTAYFDPFVDHLSAWYDKTPNATYYVAISDDQHVMGGCGVGPIAPEDGIAELQKLYVSPDYRRQGVAKSLIPECFAYAKAHYDYLYLETFHQMIAANTLYQSLGFDQLTKPLPQSEHGACDTWYLMALGEHK